jgi:hypothetical protein
VDTRSRLVISAIVENNHVMIIYNGDRTGSYMQMVRLAMLILSVSFKDRTIIEPSVEIEHSLLLSWPDKSFRPQSRVAHFGLEI